MLLGRTSIQQCWVRATSGMQQGPARKFCLDAMHPGIIWSSLGLSSLGRFFFFFCKFCCATCHPIAGSANPPVAVGARCYDYERVALRDRSRSHLPLSFEPSAPWTAVSRDLTFYYYKNRHLLISHSNGWQYEFGTQRREEIQNYHFCTHGTTARQFGWDPSQHGSGK